MLKELVTTLSADRTTGTIPTAGRKAGTILTAGMTTGNTIFAEQHYYHHTICWEHYWHRINCWQDCRYYSHPLLKIMLQLYYYYYYYYYYSTTTNTAQQQSLLRSHKEGYINQHAVWMIQRAVSYACLVIGTDSWWYEQSAGDTNSQLSSRYIFNRKILL
jgi:hypothetical protein